MKSQWVDDVIESLEYEPEEWTEQPRTLRGMFENKAKEWCLWVGESGLSWPYDNLRLLTPREDTPGYFQRCKLVKAIKKWKKRSLVSRSNP